MIAVHREEASQILQEFDKHDVNVVVNLDNLAVEKRRQTPGLRAPETEEPRPSTEDTNKSGEDDDDDEDKDDVTEDATKKKTTTMKMKGTNTSNNMNLHCLIFYMMTLRMN